MIFRFDAGRLSLDLLMTRGARGTNTPRELLVEPADLDRWIAKASIERSDFRCTAADLARIRELREAIDHTVRKTVHGEQPERFATDRLARVSAGPSPTPPTFTLVDGRARATGERVCNGSELETLLARDAINLLASSSLERVGVCAGENCCALFLNTGRERVWCSSELCGNRARVAAHRSRSQT